MVLRNGVHIANKNLSFRQVFEAMLTAKLGRDGDFYCRFAL